MSVKQTHSIYRETFNHNNKWFADKALLFFSLMEQGRALNFTNYGFSGTSYDVCNKVFGVLMEKFQKIQSK